MAVPSPNNASADNRSGCSGSGAGAGGASGRGGSSTTAHDSQLSQDVDLHHDLAIELPLVLDSCLVHVVKQRMEGVPIRNLSHRTAYRTLGPEQSLGQRRIMLQSNYRPGSTMRQENHSHLLISRLSHTALQGEPATHPQSLPPAAHRMP